VKWREMYQDFNMGVGFEFIVAPPHVEEVIGTIRKFKIDAQVIGRCDKGRNSNSLIIKSSHGKLSYS
jgi:phosphoribosylformylglycinamidine cyclo-ligase